MAAKCEMCGKGPATGNNVSHAHNKTKRRWNVNLQKTTVIKNGVSKRVKACSRCIRSATTKAA